MMRCPTCGQDRVLIAGKRRAACPLCGARWVESPALRKALQAGHPCAAHLRRPVGALLTPG